MATVIVNGKTISVKDGTLILDAARDAGVEIPTFCYQADLMGVGSCRMCLVEIEGQKKLQPSCITPVMEGMSIQTETPEILKARQGVLEFFLSNHALDCPVCDKGGECELQDMVYQHGPVEGRYAESKHRFHEKDYNLSPVIVKNSNRCVQCLRCVRVCDEVVGRSVLASLGRGHEQEETSFLRSQLDCDHCGNCIEVCPVGCFMRLPYRYKSRPWDLKGADTVCPYCATGCRMVVEQRDGEVLRARAQLGVGINSETLCARGRFGFDFINDPKRLTTPLVKKFGKLEPATWEEALEFISENLSGIDGARIGGIASPVLTNEELYSFQKLMRFTLGSPNIDSSTRWDPAVVENYIEASAMAGGGVSVFDVAEADTLFVAGSQLSDENPIVDYIARRISATHDTRIIVASPRDMKLDSSAGLSLRHIPGGLGALMKAAALSLYESNQDKLQGVAGAEDLAGLSAEVLIAEAGISAQELAGVIKRFEKAATVGITAGTDLLRQSCGLSPLGLLSDVLTALGKKVLILPILDRANQRGAWEMGVLPGLAPGYAAAPKRGLGTEQMLKAAVSGGLDAMYIIGEDPVGENPLGVSAFDATSKEGFLLVQDTVFTETAAMADCVLPGAFPAEKDGTFTNQEGRVQAMRRLKAPPGDAMADLKIITCLSNTLSSTKAACVCQKTASLHVFNEIRKEAPAYAGVSLEFNNRKNKLDDLDNKDALVNASEGGFTPAPMPTCEAAEKQRADGEFLLITGNTLFHSGQLSHRSPTLSGLQKGAALELSEGDAVVLGLSGGEDARVRGNGYEVTLPVRPRKGMRDGVAYIPEFFPGVSVGKFFPEGVSVPVVTIKKP
ncbi:MAG: NADH-quinone oxidoreductase subunit NuoG [Thermodesulfobacteriota bacterium]